jgi:chromosome segregation ATPase
MTAMMTIEAGAALRIAEMRQRRAEENEALTVHNYLLLTKACNRLTADLARARQANAELLQRLDAATGYPERLALPFVRR